jgi:hypothetical protein
VLCAVAWSFHFDPFRVDERNKKKHYNNEVSLTGYAVATGSSSGTGFETSLTLATNGFYTYATVRQ